MSFDSRPMAAATATLFLALVVTLMAAASRGAMGHDQGGPRPDRSRPGVGGRPGIDLLFDGTLDLNCATPSDLAALPGIGAVRASELVKLRAVRGGRLSSLDDILAVRGIGRKTLSRLRPYLRLTTGANCPREGPRP
ncbi:MAG: helix-hairpin-helix domain-containing protein [Deltaproteobacteria bacterium]|nr:helix-hairpin-helix domain-containing protein [Deltaproteobacteria bacterium]